MNGRDTSSESNRRTPGAGGASSSSPAEPTTNSELALQRLIESEERFRAMAEASQEGIVFAEKGHVVDANPAAVRMLGYSSADEMVGREVGDFVYADDLGLVLSNVRAETADSYAHRALRKDGRVINVEASGMRVTYRGRRMRMTTLRDVTEKVRREAMIRSIVEASKDWIWAIDLDGRHTYSNPAVEAILGYPHDEVIGVDTFDLVHPDDREHARRTIDRAVETMTGWEGLVLRWRHRDGGYRSLESSGALVLDETGSVVGFRGVDRDVTERLRMIEERASLETQLRHAQKLEAVGQLAGGIAHDFNNLLTVILGNTELMEETVQQHPELGELSEGTRDVARAARRAMVLTSRLLAFSRRQVSTPIALDLDQALLGLEGMLRRLLAENIELRLRVDSDLPNVFVDQSHLEQVIMNLVINARDAMSDGGTLTLKTTLRDFSEEDAAAHVEATAGPHVVLSVMDTGEGMDAMTVARVFEPFFTTKPVGQGTGLGLSMVYGIVRQAGGFVTVDSEPGHGSTFRIHLPATSIEPPTRSEQRTDPALSGTETILVCEDDVPVRKLATKVLERAGYAVLQAGNGAEARERVTEHAGRIHLLLTDVIMPDTDGRRLAEALRAARPDLRTLYFSGYPADAISRHGVVDESVDLIQKPFAWRELLRRVRRVLDEGSAEPE